MNDNVTPFPGSGDLPENPLMIAPRHPGWCSHDSIVIDTHTRSIRCATVACGAVLDPFSYLLTNANTVQRAWSDFREVNRRVSEVTARVDALKKEEQRLRAMVKRLQEKTGSVITVRGRDAL